MPISEVFNVDCISYMQTLPDKFFDLAITDPEYGIGVANMNMGMGVGKKCSKKKNRKWTAKDWDNKTPDEIYFEELERISVNRIIWGGNYFDLGVCKHFVIWDKEIPEGLSFSDCEYAFTSFEGANKIFRHSAYLDKKNKIHPTQKPIALYKWLIEKYAKQGDKIFDSHMGSQSSRIAAFNMGFDYWGCELDEEYFNDGNKRFIRETMQQSLFTQTATKAEITQTTIF